MQRTFLLLSFSLLILALGLNYLPYFDRSGPDPGETFLKEIHSSNRFLSSDEVAKMIIADDPTVFLVDLRSSTEFNTYSLPGAINIPIEELMNEEWKADLDQEVLDVIFYSNDDLEAEKAWGLFKQLGYKNLYVLEGGLNHWFATIMLPEAPGEMATNEERDLYDFRTGASIYFGSGTVTVPVVVDEAPEPQPVVKKEVPVEKKRKVEAEGGC